MYQKFVNSPLKQNLDMVNNLNLHKYPPSPISLTLSPQGV